MSEEILPLYYISRLPISEMDMLNIREAKSEVTDRLLRLTAPDSRCSVALAIGYDPEDDDLPVGITFACVARPHHATLVQAIRLCVEGDAQWESAVWNVEMIGGK